ncbi:MAG TPA: O-antigen ligase family protein, partial [Anaerolineales bacterium]|nr:O-antigen ligase family protein [Anaerolineales bacterium]
MIRNIVLFMRRFETLWIVLFLFLMWAMYVNSQVQMSTESVIAELVIIFGLAAVVVFRHIKERNRNWVLPVPLLIFLCFVLYAWLLIPKRPLPQYGFDSVVDITSMLLVFMLFDSLIVDNEKRKLWEKALIIVILGLAAFENLFIIAWYARWATLVGDLFTVPPIGYRLGGHLLPHPNFVAGSLNLILPLVFVRFFQSRGHRRRILGAVLILIGVIEYFTSSRAGWIAGTVAVAVTLFLAFYPEIKENLRRRNLYLLSSRRLLGASSLFILLIFVAYIFIQQSQNTPGHYGLLSGRETIWSVAWQIWSEDFWTGHGLGSFAFNYSQIEGTAGTWLSQHAHNMWLQIGAELGLLGVLFVLATLIWLGWAFWRACINLRQKRDDRLHLAAYAGIVVGLIVHQQGEYLFTIPIFSVYALLLVVLFSKLDDPPRITLANRAGYAVVVILLAVTAVGTSYASGGNGPGYALLAYQGRQSRTAALMCKSAAEAPQFTTFAFQCGALHGNLFYEDGDPDHLHLAIERIQKGLEADPFWPVHWANLSVLQWTNGDKETAFSSMLVARGKAPQNPLFAAAYGWMAEQLDKSIEARAAYKDAIIADPWLMESPFFIETQLRSALINQAFSFLVSDEDLFNLKAYQAIGLDNLATAEKEIRSA